MHSYIPMNAIILVMRVWIIEGPDNRGSTVVTINEVKS